MFMSSQLARAAAIGTVLSSGIFAQEITLGNSLSLKPGRSMVVETPQEIRRVAITNPAVAEVVPVTSKELLVNATGPGDTSLIIWPRDGARLVYQIHVEAPASPVESIREQLSRELAGQNVSLDYENGTVFLRGTVRDQTSAERAALIAGSLGKVVNLLYVDVPPAAAQVLLKVRFANVDRAASSQLGLNLVSTGAGNTVGIASTGQFSTPTVTTGASKSTFTLSDALNLFLFRPDLNLGATIRALQNRNLLEILAEPNLLAMDDKPASFVAGGQFPFPTVQGGANAGAVTISFREFGIRINFLPHVTPRGTIRLQVTPEVSSLDFANGLVFQGFTIPAISTRRVETEVELASGESFAIAGLLDNRTTQSLSKIPGIGSIPILGKLFQSVSKTKSNSELLIIVTPELVRPIPAGQSLPQVQMPKEFMKDTPTVPPQNPAVSDNGPVPQPSRLVSVPVEQLRPRLAEGVNNSTSGGGLPVPAPHVEGKTQ
jgi:pilus assembly protein CpaC